MSYLLDKKTKRKKFLGIGLGVLALLVFLYFKSPVFGGLAYSANLVFKPVLVLGHNVGGALGKLGNYFASKSSLMEENENLRQKLAEDSATMSNYGAVLVENQNLKEILGRKDENFKTILAVILEKPNQSPYDTILIDAGSKEGISLGQMVFALGHSADGVVTGNVPLGKISDVYMNSAKVVLFSTSGEKTEVFVGEKNLLMPVVGRGGGNFEMTLPRDFTVVRGDTVVMPSLTSHVLAVVQTVISDPRDSFIKALLTSPVNVQELKFVEVLIN